MSYQVEKKMYSILRSEFRASKVSKSPLYRTSESFFTFSPIQDEIEFFKNQKRKGFFIKEQDCFRNIGSENLYNPIATPFQKLISLFSFEEIKYSDVLTRIIEVFYKNFSIDKKKIIIAYPDIPEIKNNIKKSNNKSIPINKDILGCTLPLKGEHYYIKIFYIYNEGFISLANLVLVDFKKKDKCKLDSVFFLERMNMINNQSKLLYSGGRYKEVFNICNKNLNDPLFTNFVIGNIKSIQHLSNTGVNLSSNKHGYVIKKLLKELLVECNKKKIIHLNY